MKNNEKTGRFYGQDIMNPAIETMFGPESKLCACDLEVSHQQPSKTIRPYVFLLVLAPAVLFSFFILYGFLGIGYVLDIQYYGNV